MLCHFSLSKYFSLTSIISASRPCIHFYENKPPYFHNISNRHIKAIVSSNCLI